MPSHTPPLRPQVTIERIIQFLASVYSPEFIRQQLQHQPMLTNLTHNPALAQYAIGPTAASAAPPRPPSSASVLEAPVSTATTTVAPAVSLEPLSVDQGKTSDLQLVPTNQLYSHPNLDYLKALGDAPILSASTIPGLTFTGATPLPFPMGGAAGAGAATGFPVCVGVCGGRA